MNYGDHLAAAPEVPPTRSCRPKIELCQPAQNGDLASWVDNNGRDVFFGVPCVCEVLVRLHIVPGAEEKGGW